MKAIADFTQGNRDSTVILRMLTTTVDGCLLSTKVILTGAISDFSTLQYD